MTNIDQLIRDYQRGKCERERENDEYYRHEQEREIRRQNDKVNRDNHGYDEYDSYNAEC